MRNDGVQVRRQVIQLEALRRARGLKESCFKVSLLLLRGFKKRNTIVIKKDHLHEQ